MGLLLYAATILRYPVAKAYYILKFYCRLCSELALGGKQLDDLLPVWKSIEPALDDWADYCIQNTPVHPRKRDDPFQHIIVTDASAQGFGALYWCQELNKVVSHWQAWPTRRTDGSCSFEMDGMIESARFFLPPQTRDEVLLINDNVAAVEALQRGYSYSYNLNTKLNILNQLFPYHNITAKHMAGELLTIPDSLSRMKKEVFTDQQLRRFMEQAAGRFERTEWLVGNQRQHDVYP